MGLKFGPKVEAYYIILFIDAHRTIFRFRASWSSIFTYFAILFECVRRIRGKTCFKRLISIQDKQLKLMAKEKAITAIMIPRQSYKGSLDDGFLCSSTFTLVQLAHYNEEIILTSTIKPS